MPRFKTSNRSATEPALRRFEDSLGFALPSDYREFLLQQNGGQPEDGVFSAPSWGTSVVQEFFGLGSAAPGSNLEAALESAGESLPEGVIPIGCEPGGVLLCMDLAGPKRGHIYVADFTSSEEMYEVAPSFTSLLSSLERGESNVTQPHGEA